MRPNLPSRFRSSSIAPLTFLLLIALATLGVGQSVERGPECGESVASCAPTVAQSAIDRPPVVFPKVLEERLAPTSPAAQAAPTQVDGEAARSFDGALRQVLTAVRRSMGPHAHRGRSMIVDPSSAGWFAQPAAHSNGAARSDVDVLTSGAALASPRQRADATPPTAGRRAGPALQGEVVLELPNDLWRVLQARDGRYWFTSRTEGAFCYDGETITRFSKKDGLPDDNIRDVQEDSSGSLYFSTDKGITRFNGRDFELLEPVAQGKWQNRPDDLWFSGVQDSGVVYRFDGKRLHQLALPRTKEGDDATLPRDKFPNARYSPYDTYTISRDSKGNVWFGTSVLGACRYDGSSFLWVPEQELGNGAFGTRSIIEGKDGMFWLTNTRHRFAIHDGVEGVTAPRYSRMRGIGDSGEYKQSDYEVFISSTVGDDGAMWFASLGGVVWRYDGASMTPFPVTENGEPHWIFSIYKDKRGVLWVGTQEHGVYRLQGDVFKRFKP